ncbi:diguanylate cyclase (GGDEF)-like protein [Litorivivens lipolytica]|uniref:Diguanylate cyclase (GGDEF)-like protein n=1 Tax=Litorivivens lipolytica TaxID=1524264 RepID=A0A7W4Z6M1_9GAMM|nr:sensor domain-containing diguanylate cyclase [Litorivivens lipolytica]MBB3048664.1 diguanylate cyclase (GGDEF)-like protein [Litorivivens lipolytica]
MLAPKYPENEAERLEELLALEVLDTPNEDRFDRITRLASRLLHKPIALVSLVDADRQWFKSRTGLSATETSREISFCGHVVQNAEPLIVEDTLLDPRFADNPLVVSGLEMRFYAGFPLFSKQGCVLGTLCVIDQKPSALSTSDRRALTELARLVERELYCQMPNYTDPVTTLASRSGFYGLAGKVLQTPCSSLLPATMVSLDIKGFRDINVMQGRAQGDKILHSFGDAISHFFRGTDLIGRIGADEFGLLMLGCSRTWAKRRVHAFEEHMVSRGLDGNGLCPIHFSHTVVAYSPETHKSAEHLMMEVNRQMYWQHPSTALGQRKNGRRV